MTKAGPGPDSPAPQAAAPAEDNVMDLIYSFFGDESGAAAVEYAIMAMFVAVALMAGANTFYSAVRSLFAGVFTSWPS